MEIQYPYNKGDSSDSSESGEKQFKFQSFIKFKPKTKNNSNEDKNSLKGAENKVKALLSEYIKDIQQGKRNERNQNFNFNANPRKEKRRNTDKNNINIRNKTQIQKEDSKKSTLLFLFNNNHNHKNNKKNFTTFILSPSKNKNISRKKERKKCTNENLNIHSICNNINIKNKGNINDKKNKKLQKPYKRNTKVEKLEKMLDKLKDKDINNKSNSYIMNLDSILNSKNDIKNEIINKDKDNQMNNKNEIINKIFEKKDKKSRNDIFNESFHNSIISEGSQYNINQKSFEIKDDKKKQFKNKNSSNLQLHNIRINLNISKEDIPLSVRKKNTMNLSRIKYKNIIKNKGNQPLIRDKKNIRFSNAKINDEKDQFIRRNFFKNNSDFKNIKEKLKESLILRPEDLESTKRNKNRSSAHIKAIKKINSNKTDINQSKIKNKNMKNINKSINSINLGYINKNEIAKKSNSSTNNQNNFNFNFAHLSKKNNLKIEKNKVKNNNENESEQTLKTTNKENKINGNQLSNKDNLNILPNNNIELNSSINIEKYRNMVRKSNIYDSLDDEEIEDEGDESILYLDPNSFFVRFFDGILFIFSIISFVETPFYLAITHDFCREKKLTIISAFNISTELLYICDLFLGFFRAFYNWEEQLITRHRSIIKKYLSEWFILDLISAVPIYILNKLYEPYCNEFELSSTYYNIVLHNLQYFLICNKLFKLIKVHTNNQALKIFSNKVSDTFKIFFTIFLGISALNYSACIYIFIARNSYPNWILHTGLGTHSFFHIYICSIYIIIMALTTVGYGDITCYSFYEIIYQLFLLIVGIIAYSYAVTSFSNYVQKINEKSADFSKKKSILDEIKLSHPNLPEDLYDKILKHLTYKYKYEKKYKNLIFDCLPISLKNDLISEMYKPIIKNFIFFKNFQNKDFIVRVILAFKAVIAEKNDILVTEGDLLEDIMFVKKGVLSVELPLNMTNPQKNIDKYLNGPLLKEENEKNLENINNFTDSWILSGANNNIKNIINLNNANKNDNRNNIHSTNFDVTKTKQTFNKNKEKVNIPEEIKYVKILGIRNNEHFGDVLMFLEKRSPLRLRVKSKKCELFFLKKMDAIKISISHPTIWRNINKKSIYNFEQIKKCIIRIVEIFCSVKHLKSFDKRNTIYEELMNQAKKEKEKKIKKAIKSIKIKKILPPIKENKLLRSYSYSFRNNKYFQKIFKINNIINYKENRFKSKSLKRFKTTYKIDEFYSHKKKYKLNLKLDSLTINNNKIKYKNNKNKKYKGYSKKLSDLYNGRYKYYKGVNNKYPKISKKTIITEKNESENVLSSKNNIKINNIIYNQKESSKSNFIKNNSLINNKKNIIDKIGSTSSKTIKLEESFSYHYFRNDNDSELIENNSKDEDKSNITSSDKSVNNEIGPREEILINNENNNLLNKKLLNQFYPKNELIGNINDHKIIYKNSKIKMLLNSFIKEDDLIDEGNSNINDNNIDIHNNYINKNNNINKVLSSKSIISSSLNSQYDKMGRKSREFNNNILSIKRNISLLIQSSYENCNLLTKERLIKNKLFQETLKKFLVSELINELAFHNTDRFKEKNPLLDSNHKDINNLKSKSQINQKDKKERIISNIYFNLPMANKLIKTNTLSNIVKNNFPLKKKTLKRTSSLDEKDIQKNRKNTTEIRNYFNNDNKKNNYNTSVMKKTKIKRRFTSGKELFNSTLKLGNISNELSHKKLSRKRSLIFFSPYLKSKKKQDSSMLLSQINLNIEKTNQNLNNPDEFYSNYFNYLLQEKRKGKKNTSNETGFFGQLKKDNSEQKKEKSKKSGNLLKKQG